MTRYKAGTPEGVRPTELTHTRLGGVSPSICDDIENSRSRVHIDKQALGGRYPSFEGGSGGSQFTTRSTMTPRTLVRYP